MSAIPNKAIQQCFQTVRPNADCTKHFSGHHSMLLEISDQTMHLITRQYTPICDVNRMRNLLAGQGAATSRVTLEYLPCGCHKLRFTR